MVEMINVDIPRVAKTNNLMLLVGTNPLPNYVAARLLAREDTHLHFVVTEEIKQTEIHKRLAKLLGREPTDEKQYLTVEASSPKDIRDKVNARVVSKEYSGSWGLNYTGGKKVMATHAYRAMEAALAGKAQSGVYSYLDADSLSLVIETPNSAIPYPVDLSIRISWEQILELHGQSLVCTPKKKPFHDEVARALVEYCQQKKNHEGWRDFVREMRKQKTSTSGVEVEGRQLPVGVPVIGGRTPSELAREWETDIHDLPEWEYGKKQNFWKTEVEYLSGWLHGKWLEDHVFAEALKAGCNTDVQQVIGSIRLKRLKEFELDVVAMRGYRLFAMSVTTVAENPKAEYDLARMKLFEALIRARQMGGDEAKVALITFSKDPKQLEQQVAEKLFLSPESVSDFRDYRSPVRVFGLTDLPDLAQHLEKWFKEVR